MHVEDGLYREVGARRTLKRRDPPSRARTSFCIASGRRFLVGHQHRAKTKATPAEKAEPESSPHRHDSDEEETPLHPDPTTPGDYIGPPLHGKTDPPAEMDDAYPTLDDERRNYHHHPNEPATTEFAFDPLAGDAAADLAGDFGSQFLEGATRGEDLSERALALEDDSDTPLDLLLDEEDLEAEGEPIEEIDEAPRPPRSNARRRTA